MTEAFCRCTTMGRVLSFVLLGILITCIAGAKYGKLQGQEHEDQVACECDELQAQVNGLQKNVTELWNYIYTLRNAMASQLRHLREHQVQAEHTIEDLTHQREHAGHTSDYHSHSHQDSGEHDHHAEESSHHDHHSEDSTHHDDHHHDDSTHSHQDESTHHDGHDHHEESSHSDDHHHHHHDEHDSSSHGHSHEVTDHSHHDDHSKEQTKDKDDDKDDSSKEKKEAIAEKVVVATTHHHHSHDHSHDFRSASARSHSHGHHSHHDHRGHQSTVNKTVVFPRPSEHSQYNFASCRVEPNRAIPEDQQQDIRGEVTFWQLKSGGPLGIHVRLQGFQMGSHSQHQQLQTEDNEEAAVASNDHQHGTSHKHGFHVHAMGDMSNGCQSTGPHYNPENVNHGGPSSAVRHVGDLGNIECDDHGNTNIMFSDPVASLIGEYSIINRALVVHSSADDYGTNPDDPESLRTGNAGTRLACCIIQSADRPSLKSLKYLKRTKQYQTR